MTKAEAAKCIAEGKDIAVANAAFTKTTLWRYGVPRLTRCTPLATDTPRVDLSARPWEQVKHDGIRVRIADSGSSTTTPAGRDRIPVLPDGRHVIGDDFEYEDTADRVVDPRRIVGTWEQFEADRDEYVGRKVAADRREAEQARERSTARRAAAVVASKLTAAGFDSARSDDDGSVVLSREDAARLLALSAY